RPAGAGQLSRRLQPRPAARHGSDAARREPGARVVRPLEQSDRPDPAAHRNEPGGMGRRGSWGAKIQVDHALRQRLVDAVDPHVGFDAAWMATTGLGYLDRRLWDDAGTVEAGPWVSTTRTR